MPTVFRLGSTRIVIFANDHAPPHVHALTPDGSAKVVLGPTAADVAIVEAHGLTPGQCRWIIVAVAERHATCTIARRRRHGG